MIYDSESQKAFIQECVRKYPTTYEKAIQLCNSFGAAVQNGEVVDPKLQQEWINPKNPMKAKEKDGGGPK